ncbi:glutathione S-transferase family protein [Gimibacter soli]|uniref:Glutathione S-transferase family protein n=1 Tax=Gimibacter soli TaxID=3024400 RepID=A0AAF0BM13_9PROT|nr:glutathione S-transferase family protein [Gimibacter soli]WCL54872.1 glutathione S-transferase family protein [Gimibacter soli]
MVRQLFELCGRDPALRFSPYVWRVRLILEHKGLAFEGIPWRFLDKPSIEPAGSKTVPVLKDGARWVADSFDIACYLDAAYPDRTVFGGEEGRAPARFFNEWLNRTVVLGIFPMIVADIASVLDDENAVYFRQTREKYLGRSLEEAQAGREAAHAQFLKGLAPVRATLERQPYLGGNRPGFADFALMGTLMWPHVVSGFDVLEGAGPIVDWRTRMDAEMGGVMDRATRA